MTFLQPSILWALPLILLPVIIHLINRLRHRPQPWGAMMFLLRANRASTSHAKLRQLLILLFRCLAVLALILFVSRPLAGGWIGWAISPAPDVVIILLDRSASMESTVAGGTATRREQALKLLADAAEGYQGRSQLVVIDSATLTAQTVAGASALLEPALSGPTDAASDLPAMLQAARTWMVDNQAGTTEIWIASDLQQSNWRPEDDRWRAAVDELTQLPQRARIRLLALGDSDSPDAGVALVESAVQRRGAQHDLLVALDVRHSGAGATTLPLTFVLNGTTTTHDLSLEGSLVRWRHRVELGERRSAGWGGFMLPADGNLRDNSAWFVFAPQDGARTQVVSEKPEVVRAVGLAAAALAGRGGEMEAPVLPADFPAANLAGQSVLVWQGRLPSGESSDRVRSFVGDGGVVLFLPGDTGDDVEFAGMKWRSADTVQADDAYGAKRWDRDEGPWADTEEGFVLPIEELKVLRRCVPIGDGSVLATFQDDEPMLLRRTLGRGTAYFLGTLPEPGWSNLGNGPVLIPMMHRLVQEGVRRLNQENLLVCGELPVADLNRSWTSLDAPGKDIRFDAGIYQSGERLVAVNRAPSEDDSARIDTETAAALFGNLPVQLFEQRGALAESLQGEIWRVLLFGMLLFLLVEGFLILPAKPPPGGPAAAPERHSQPMSHPVS